MKIGSTGAELLRAEGQTSVYAVRRTDREANMEKLIAAFRKFAKTSKKTEHLKILFTNKCTLLLNT